MIVEPVEMNFSNKNLIMIVSGMPGVGKSTLAQSAPGTLTVDTDGGMVRVNKDHRKTASFCQTYEEVLADLKAADGKYQTIVIDTCGSLIDYMKEWAMRADPKASKKDGGFSLQGYGIIKSEFIRLSTELRKKFNVIYLFHENMTKNGDDGVFYELVVEGATRTLVFQPADLACHMFVDHGKRYAGFTPTESYNAKSAYGIKGIIEIPELKPGDPNDFLTKLFAKVRENLENESKSLAPQKETYDAAIKEAKDICAAVNTPEDVPKAADAIKALSHALTSEKEAKDMLKKRLAELNIVWDKTSKVYRYAE